MAVNPGARLDEMADQPSQQPSQLPASLQAAWGVAQRLAKGPKPALSLDRIVAGAIALADAEGLDAVSMSKVAGQLGTATMSLYRYLGAKRELLDLMLDRAYGAPPQLPDPLAWRPGLTLWAGAQLSRMREHPWVVRVPIAGPPITPNQLRWTEFGLATLHDTGLGPNEKLSTILLVSGFVRNWVTLTADLRQSATTAELSQTMPQYAGHLRQLLRVDEFPELTTVLASGVLDEEDMNDDDYTFGLERVLDGIGVLIATRT
jgi:AcrR family transcriptional regulator